MKSKLVIIHAIKKNMTGIQLENNFEVEKEIPITTQITLQIVDRISNNFSLN